MGILDVLPQLPTLMKKQNEIESAAHEDSDMLPFELDLLQIDLNNADSVEAYNFLAESIESRAEFYEKEAAYYSGVAKKLSALTKKYKEFVKNVAVESGTDEIRGKSIRFKISKAKPSLVVDDLTKLSDYMKQKIEMVLDKDRVKQDIELGVPVDGAHIEQSYSLRKYPITGRDVK